MPDASTIVLPADERARLVAMLVRHEGLKLKPYTDTRGKLTIGVGRNLTDVGISTPEARILLDTDINAAVLYLAAHHGGWFLPLDPPRQAAVVDMLFNLGPLTFEEFRKALQALAAGRYPDAARELVTSAAARQTGGRYQELADMLVTGTWGPLSPP